jgi:phosphatidylserine decarboxylase
MQSKMPGTRGPYPKHRRAYRIGGWLPHDKKAIRDHVNRIVQHANDAQFASFIPQVQSLSDLIYNNPIVYMLFTEMLTEVPVLPPYDKDPSLQPEIRDVPTLLTALNYQVQNPIQYNDSVQIGTPINAILDWPMATKAGFAAFLRDDVNTCFQNILSYWGGFLQNDSRSIETVTTANGGWLSAAAQNDPDNPGLKDFLKTYKVPNPSDIHYGFTSWDQFFVRHFLDGLRPVADPNDASVITSAAESTPFYIQNNVQLLDSFWAKDQHYSLQHMLGSEELAKQFVGGTVYQAFLSADNYHNWHAPVTGKYTQPPVILPGTYYSEPLLWGFDPDLDQKPVPTPDAAADARSQGYISCVARRGVAIIQPDDASIGPVALVWIGMAEVSSIEFDNLSHFNKGDEIGRFHFGGSTHCLIFGPNVVFTPEANVVPVDPTHSDLGQPIVEVCSKLGTVKPR